MRILVTGGLGFIGSNFILHILKNYPEIEIINLDAGLTGSNTKNLTEIEKSSKYNFVSGNINDKSCVEKIIFEPMLTFNVFANSLPSKAPRFLKLMSPFFKNFCCLIVNKDNYY